MNALIIGKGQVGQAVAYICSQLGHTWSFFGSKDDQSQFEGRVRQSDVVILAIPNQNDGDTALGYVLKAVKLGKRVAVCVKDFLGYRFDDVRPHLKNVFYTASAGGGSGLLSVLACPRIRVTQITGVVNGTLNFLFSECALGRDPYIVLAEAQELGLCEPGNNSLADVVNGELQDILLKATIIFNHSMVSKETLNAREFATLYVGEDEVIRQLGRKTVRFVVSVSKQENPALTDSLYSCLHVRKDGWHIQAGLAQMSSLPFSPFPVREQNSLVIEDYGGLTQITGLGAGPIPTAATMIMDVMN